MATFDYKAARDAGWDDQQIADFLAEKKAAGVTLTIPRADYDAYQKKATPPSTPASDNFWDQPSTVGGPAGAAINFGKGTVSTLGKVGAGVGTEIGKAGLGLGELATKGVAKIGEIMGDKEGADYWNNVSKGVKGISEAVYEKPFAESNASIPGKVGQGLGVATVFAAPSTAIVKGQELLGGLAKGLPWIIQKAAQVAPEIAGTGATEYARSGGDADAALGAGTFAGVLSALTHVSADAFRAVIPQGLKDNVARVLGYTGKTSLKDAATTKRVDDAVGAFTTIARLSPDIKVIDNSGVEKVFDPSRTTFKELPQALYQAKNKIYDAYSSVAKNAGEEGVSFGQKDFNDILSALDKYMGRGYTPAFSNKASQIKDAILRFGKINPADGTVYFKNTDPGEIQTLIQNINQDVNPLSDKAGAQVANEASSKLRSVLDEKIEAATGDKYQQLRTAYGQLKSVEKDVLDHYKKAMRRAGGFASDFIDGIAVVDSLQGILTANPAAMVRGTLIEGTKKLFQYLRDPEVNMQRVFRIIQNGSKARPPTPLKTRAFGSPGPTK